MGRKPVGKKPMTAAQRQRRRRSKVRKDQLELGRRAVKEKKLLKHAKDYMPAPSGPQLIYYRKITFNTPDGPREYWAPLQQPWASVRQELLTDDDIRGLANDIAKEAKRRGMELEVCTHIFGSGFRHYLGDGEDPPMPFEKTLAQFATPDAQQPVG